MLTHNQESSKQINVSNTETTLILCGYSRERANTVLNKEVRKDDEKWDEKIREHNKRRKKCRGMKLTRTSEKYESFFSESEKKSV